MAEMNTFECVLHPYVVSDGDKCLACMWERFTKSYDKAFEAAEDMRGIGFQVPQEYTDMEREVQIPGMSRPATPPMFWRLQLARRSHVSRRPVAQTDDELALMVQANDVEDAFMSMLQEREEQRQDEHPEPDNLPEVIPAAAAPVANNEWEEEDEEKEEEKEESKEGEGVVEGREPPTEDEEEEVVELGSDMPEGEIMPAPVPVPAAVEVIDLTGDDREERREAKRQRQLERQYAREDEAFRRWELEFFGVNIHAKPA